MSRSAPDDDVITQTYVSPRMTDDAYRTIVLASDLHPGEEEDKRRESLRETIRNSLSWYADRYDADEVWLGGDIGEVEDVKAWLVEDEHEDAFLPYGFEQVSIAIGDGDVEQSGDGRTGWYNGATDRDSDLLHDLDRSGRVAYGKEITSYGNVGGQSVPIRMKHDPKDLNVDWYTTPRQAEVWGDHHELDDPQILLYGHTHTPYARVLRNSLVIGVGSRFKNYHARDGMPDRSLQVLRMGEDVELYHIDLDADDPEAELFEYQRFSLEDGGFTEKETDHQVPDIEQRFVLPQKYYNLQEEAEQLISEIEREQEELMVVAD